MAIEAFQYNASSGSAGMSASLGATTRAGGVVVLFVMATGTGTTTGTWGAVSGLTVLSSGTVTAASTWLSWQVYWKYFPTSGADSPYSPVYSSTKTRFAFYLVEYRGLSSAPFGTLATNPITTAGTTVDAPSVTLATPPSALVSFAGAAGSSIGGVAVPSGMTESSIYSGNTSIGGGIAHQTGLSGATGAKTWTGVNYTVAAGLSVGAFEAPTRPTTTVRSGAVTRSSRW